MKSTPTERFWGLRTCETGVIICFVLAEANDGQGLLACNGFEAAYASIYQKYRLFTLTQIKMKAIFSWINTALGFISPSKSLSLLFLTTEKPRMEWNLGLQREMRFPSLFKLFNPGLCHFSAR